MAERRFTEAEVAAIFEKATEAQHTARRALPSGDEAGERGMTLRELQEIGREIGVDPQLVARAARSLDVAGRPTSRRFLGLPIGVGRTVDLGRKLSDDEWEHLVVDLRETFDARGSMRQEGSFRQWTNGNLQALLEPTATGHRLRMRTLKGDAMAWMAGGFGMLALSVVTSILSALRGPISDPAALSGIVLPGLIGVAMFSLGALRLPRWARTRRQQMEEIATRLALQTGEKPQTE